MLVSDASGPRRIIIEAQHVGIVERKEEGGWKEPEERKQKRDRGREGDVNNN